MGINYVDSVVVYNRYVTGLREEEQYFGTRFDLVRIELTEGANKQKSGLEDASACVVKVPKSSWKKPYLPPKVWEKLTTEEMLESFTLNKGSDFFVIVEKDDFNIHADLPVGLVESKDYQAQGYEGYFDYVKAKYGYAFGVDTVDVYTVIPRFEIGGR
ncbi:hypothetical protein D3Z36_14535 [Lachnospiraceae bacterium]|nr:hypothetical protein [Lachnospiraceae bacterium]